MFGLSQSLLEGFLFVSEAYGCCKSEDTLLRLRDEGRLLPNADYDCAFGEMVDNYFRVGEMYIRCDSVFMRGVK